MVNPRDEGDSLVYLKSLDFTTQESPSSTRWGGSTETLNGIHRCEKRKSLEEIYDIMCETAEIIYLKPTSYLEAINLSKHYNNAINYSNFIILKTMQDKKINKIVSFDSGFDKINGIERIYL